MNKTHSWHSARASKPVAHVHHQGFMEQPGPMRGQFHQQPFGAQRGTVAAPGFHGVGPAAYHFQYHHAVYPSERRQQTCCERPHFHNAHLRMQTWSSTTVLSYLYQSERRRHY